MTWTYYVEQQTLKIKKCYFDCEANGCSEDIRE